MVCFIDPAWRRGVGGASHDPVQWRDHDQGLFFFFFCNRKLIRWSVNYRRLKRSLIFIRQLAERYQGIDQARLQGERTESSSRASAREDDCQPPTFHCWLWIIGCSPVCCQGIHGHAMNTGLKDPADNSSDSSTMTPGRIPSLIWNQYNTAWVWGRMCH